MASDKTWVDWFFVGVVGLVAVAGGLAGLLACAAVMLLVLAGLSCVCGGLL